MHYIDYTSTHYENILVEKGYYLTLNTLILEKKNNTCTREAPIGEALIGEAPIGEAPIGAI